MNKNTFLIIFIIVSSCNNYISEDIPNNLTLKEFKTKKYVLDSMSLGNPISLCYFEGDNKEKYFSFLNRFNNSVYYYNYDQQKIYKTIKLDTEGPNGVGKANSHLVYNLDSIFIYSRNRHLYILNDKARVLDKIKVKNKEVISVDPIINNMSSIFKLKDKIYLSGISREQKASKTIVDLKTKEIRHFFPYPDDIYYTKSVHPLYKFTFQEYNKKNQVFIYSFAADPNIYIVDIKKPDQFEKKFAGNQNIKIQNIEFTKWNNLKKEMDFYLENDSYGGIIYDEYNNLYYRFMFHKLSKDERRIYNSITDKLVTVLILNKNFKIIGKKILPRNKYFLGTIFINKFGLHIAKIDEEENILTFGILKVVKNEN